MCAIRCQAPRGPTPHGTTRMQLTTMVHDLVREVRTIRHFSVFGISCVRGRATVINLSRQGLTKTNVPGEPLMSTCSGVRGRVFCCSKWKERHPRKSVQKGGPHTTGVWQTGSPKQRHVTESVFLLSLKTVATWHMSQSYNTTSAGLSGLWAQLLSRRSLGGPLPPSTTHGKKGTA